MFKKDLFIEACEMSVLEGQGAIRELVTEAVRDPAGIVAELGEPSKPGVEVLYHTPQVTVINFIWSPCMTLCPHDHRIFAVIGLYGGREDNVFWRRISEQGSEESAMIEAAGALSMGPGEVATLGVDIIHSVANPLTKLSSAIHVYGGDFFEPPKPRHQWDHETLIEQPWRMEDTRAVFRAAEIRFNAGIAAGLAP